MNRCMHASRKKKAFVGSTIPIINYRVYQKYLPVFERLYNENPKDYRNGTGAKFNVWSRRYAWNFEKVDLRKLLLTCNRSCKKCIVEVFKVSAGDI
jgi:hypothetical protein